MPGLREQAGSFRTRTGRCRINQEGIRLQARPWLSLGCIYEGVLRQGSRRRRAGLATIYLGILVGYVSLTALVPLAGAVVGLVVVGFLTGAMLCRRTGQFTAVRDIAFEDVEDVIALEGWPVVSPLRFVVRYRADGETRCRAIELPSRFYAESLKDFEVGIHLFAAQGIDVQTRDVLA